MNNPIGGGPTAGVMGPPMGLSHDRGPRGTNSGGAPPFGGLHGGVPHDFLQDALSSTYYGGPPDNGFLPEWDWVSQRTRSSKSQARYSGGVGAPHNTKRISSTKSYDTSVGGYSKGGLAG